ncbi:CGNR zinc finger domain-containing protein [Arsenicicoccus dermatophilus]|uniref:CGNR zinc finger domain-containing protein n=1 Tax=Arsenicicoccus dermatophilus TaxID=1076331 RepID=UPI00391710B1
MDSSATPTFRTGDVLATVFTGTLTERHGDTVEWIPTPERLLEWLAVNALAVESCSEAELASAHRLREAIHVAGTAAATTDAGEPLPPVALRTINEAARGGRACPQLGADGERTWRLGGSGRGRVGDALSVIAADAIEILTSANRDRLALCASPTCREMFVDNSQSHTRRWCDMNVCGNRQKKARHRSAARRTG